MLGHLISLTSSIGNCWWLIIPLCSLLLVSPSSSIQTISSSFHSIHLHVVGPLVDILIPIVVLVKWNWICWIGMGVGSKETEVVGSSLDFLLPSWLDWMMTQRNWAMLRVRISI